MLVQVLILALLPLAAPVFAASPEEPARVIEQSISESGRSLPELIKPILLNRNAQHGLTFDEVVESVKLRANKLNLSFAGANFLPRPQEKGTGASTSGLRVAILSFCDPELAIEMLALVPEFAVFLPCRIVVLQDRSGHIRLMTIDWRAEWFAAAKGQPSITPELLARLQRLLAKLGDVVDSGARGDL